jgi:membrane-bound lytic murein transglycosylase B
MFRGLGGDLLGRRLAMWVLAGLALLVSSAGMAGAQGVSQTQYDGEGTEVPADRIQSLEERVSEQDAALEAKIRDISEVGRDLRETQARVDGAETRASELREQTQELEQKMASQRRSYQESKARYEEQARAAYQGHNLEGLGALIDGWLGSRRGVSGGQISGLARVLIDGRQDLEDYEESRTMLRHMVRQIGQKQKDYESAVEEHRTSKEELQTQEAALDESIADLRSDKDRTADRLEELEAAERARIQRSRAATGGGTAGKGRQIGIARDEIVARPVAPMPKREYIKLYKESAKEYGFGKDWYVLAAVGQVESNHGQNMGPSSAGAMGPMQFLPSTWAASGVDGNGDGRANIMDPEDAIPAAAGYLREGGAPRDWYAALYSYNHADWYVKKVFAVAEAYRRLAKDERVEPYI